jgi:hypothetical protein
MDPILTTIIGALAAGAVAKGKEIASQAVTDAYDALKTLIVHKLGKAGAVQSVEDEPESEAGHTALAEALAKKQLQSNVELQRSAQHLDKALAEAKEAGVPGAGDIEIGQVRGKVNATVRDLVASGRIKLDAIIAETGDATVEELRAGGTEKN